MKPQVKGFAASLRAWFGRHQRPLPWRKTRDPYRIWVAEIMLQQTRAAAVIPYYERFLARFPDIKSLARAQEPEVLECWSGLGYYSRARNLQRAARHVVEELRGRLPRLHEDWLKLPGVGPYTAAAVASIAFGEPVAVLDGNVARVMTRVANHHGDIRSGAVRDQLRQQAQRLLDRRRPGEFNQALMELGATVCLPREPDCQRCPVERWCQARRLGLENQLPVKLGRQQSVAVEMAVALVRRGGRILVRQRPHDATLMPGFWELPDLEGLRRLERLGEFRHAITWHNYRVTVWSASLHGRRPAGCRWIPQKDLARLPLATIARKALRLTTAPGAAVRRSPPPKPS